MANIGKLNVSFHRPGWLKDRFPGDKETQAQGQQPNDLPERKNKPLVQFSRVNKYTRLPGVNAVNDALVRTVPVIGTQQELLRQIRAHVSSTRVPDLVIVGENHDHGVTLPTTLTVLHQVRGAAGERKLLMEYEGREMEDARSHDDWQAAFDQSLLDGSAFHYPPELDETNFRNVYSACWSAKNLGMAVQGFDAEKSTAPHLEQRERAMVGAVAGALAGSGTVVVVAGTHHVAPLHEAFAGQVHTVALANMPLLPAGGTDTAKRYSYLLSTPGILELRFTNALTAAEVDPTKFLREMQGAP